MKKKTLNCQFVRLVGLRLDLIFAYTLVFGLTDINLNEFFKLRTDHRHRGHKYKLFLPGCRSNTRHNFFTYRAGRIWNNLPADNTDFSHLNSFKRVHFVVILRNRDKFTSLANSRSLNWSDADHRQLMR